MLSSLFLLFSIMSHANSLQCTKGELRIVNTGQLTTEVASYCYNSDKTVLMSEACKNGNCHGLNQEMTLKFSDIFSAIGNPGFTLCRKLGGAPEILEFKVKDSWFKLDRCNFKDGSFVNTGELIHFYRSKKRLL